MFYHSSTASRGRRREGRKTVTPPMERDLRHSLHSQQPYTPLFLSSFAVSHCSHTSISNHTTSHHTTPHHNLCVFLPPSPTHTPHLRTSHCPCSGIFAYSASEYRRYTVPGLTRPVRPARWTAEAVSRQRRRERGRSAAVEEGIRQ
jgi:hypothetical protein